MGAATASRKFTCDDIKTVVAFFCTGQYQNLGSRYNMGILFDSGHSKKAVSEVSVTLSKIIYTKTEGTHTWYLRPHFSSANI